ncbi:hypothetical protein ACJMK2_042453 [Sinanodonta woodiana]|uniref:Uncharacterized protein n=1 Tax=Sinanodonta woodiana TaxID=1069815 RepID=A0ABD3W8F9_SINWO
MRRTCKEKCRGPPIDVPRTAWLNVSNIIEVSDGKIASKEFEVDNANHSYMESRAMISDINIVEKGLNQGPTCEDGQCGHVLVGSIDNILIGLSTTNENKFHIDQKQELSTLLKNGEMPRSCTNISDSYLPCQDLKAGKRGSSGHSSMDVESWRHLNLNENRDHEVHSYVSATNLISSQLMDVSLDDRATSLVKVKDDMSERSEIRFDVKTKCHVDTYEYQKDDENSATQIRRTTNEDIRMQESVSDSREVVDRMYHSTPNNDTEPYVTVTDICDTERHGTTFDTCGTSSIDFYILTLPSGSPFVMSSNVEPEQHTNSYIRNVEDDVEDITNSLQE